MQSRPVPSAIAGLALAIGSAWGQPQARGGVTGESGPSLGSIGESADPAGSTQPVITGGPASAGHFSPAPIEHDTPETLHAPTIIGRLDPARFEPIAAEATKIDIDAAAQADPDVLLMGEAESAGLWKTLLEARISPWVLIGGAIGLVVAVLAALVAVSRHSAQQTRRRLREEGPPVVFEGGASIELEGDRAAIDQWKRDDDGDSTQGQPTARRAESGMRY